MCCMGDEGTRMIGFTVRLSEDEEKALSTEAKSKGKERAVYAREIIQAHLLKQQFSQNLRSEMLSILESEEFDDVFVEKFFRAYRGRKED